MNKRAIFTLAGHRKWECHTMSRECQKVRPAVLLLGIEGSPEVGPGSQAIPMAGLPTPTFFYLGSLKRPLPFPWQAEWLGYLLGEW